MRCLWLLVLVLLVGGCGKSAPDSGVTGNVTILGSLELPKSEIIDEDTVYTQSSYLKNGKWHPYRCTLCHKYAEMSEYAAWCQPCADKTDRQSGPGYDIVWHQGRFEDAPPTGDCYPGAIVGDGLIGPGERGSGLLVVDPEAIERVCAEREVEERDNPLAALERRLAVVEAELRHQERERYFGWRPR